MSPLSLSVGCMSSIIYPHGMDLFLISLFCLLGQSLQTGPQMNCTVLAQLVIHLQWGRRGSHPWGGKIAWRRERLPTPVLWTGEFHGLYIVHGVAKSQTQLRDFHVGVWAAPLRTLPQASELSLTQRTPVFPHCGGTLQLSETPGLFGINDREIPVGSTTQWEQRTLWMSQEWMDKEAVVHIHHGILLSH